MNSYYTNKIFLSILSLLAIILTSCKGNAPLPISIATVIIETPAELSNVEFQSQTITFRNLSTGEKITITPNATGGISATLLDGIYDCEYSALITYSTKNDDDEHEQINGKLTGGLDAITIAGGATTTTIPAHLVFESDDFIFEEIFFTGTLRSSGSQYVGTSYIKIYNNTDHVLYADGVAFCESKFRSTQSYEFTPNVRDYAMTVQSIYVIPGSGRDYPVQPGESLTICDIGIDHRNANPLAFDLSHADFEWFDVSSSASVLDIDSPTVPNLDKWYCYTQTIYSMHNRGFSAFALARIPQSVSKEAFLRDNFYSYDYVMYLDAGTFYMSGSAYQLPNSWIIDGVNCSVEEKRAWNILPPSIDTGWTHCGYIDKDESRYFRSVRRKLEYVNEDGSMHLQDTNNSTNDFNTECIPSLIELQGTAINTSGTKATVITYDGVTPRPSTKGGHQ